MWGLASNRDTDDIREAPSLYMDQALLKEGASVSAFDPEAMENVRKQIGDKIQYGKDEYDVLDGADFLIIATEMGGLPYNPTSKRMARSMKAKLISTDAISTT